MKRTLKRGLKGLEIVKMETIGFSIDLWTSHVSSGFTCLSERLLVGHPVEQARLLGAVL
jgi:hypothetical protein